MNPPNIEVEFSDVCVVLDGCLNGDLFKFGPWLAAILIGVELMFWSWFIYFITKRLIKRQTSLPVDKDGERFDNSDSYPPRHGK